MLTNTVHISSISGCKVLHYYGTGAGLLIRLDPGCSYKPRGNTLKPFTSCVDTKTSNQIN